jgi:GntR family transcriptional regulator
MQIRRSDSLAVQVARELRQRLKREYVSGGRLPSEPEMAAQFGVSRGTVRHALTILEREGVIFRRQGTGTFVNKYVLRIRARAEPAYEFTELLRIAGFDAGIQLVAVEHLALPKDIAESLDTEPGSQALSVTKLFLADGQPAIYCIDIVPLSLFCEDYREEELHQPIFELIERCCGQTIDLNLTELIPEVADEQLARWLDMKPGQPLLRFDEVGHNQAGNPVLFSRIYFKDEYIRFTILRTKI